MRDPIISIAKATAIASLALAGIAVAGTPRHPDELDLPPMRIQTLEPAVDTLDCGIPVLYFENHDLPILSAVILFRAGESYFSDTDLPVGRILDEAWRSGGTAALDPDSLDKELSDLEATVRSWIGNFSSGISIDLASEDADRALPIWRDLAVRPKLDEARIERAKDHRLKDIQSINQTPSRIAEQRFLQLLYGEKHPEARLETRAEITAVGREDLAALHGRFAHPRNAWIGVAGDFDPEDIKERLNRLFGEWAREAGLFVESEKREWPLGSSPGLFLLPGEHAQSHIRIGRIVPGLRLDSPDYPATQILDFALGFGRMYYRSRSEGISYGAAVMLSVDDEKAVLNGFGSCRNDAADDMIRLFLEEMAAVMDRPITEEEAETSRFFRLSLEASRDERPRNSVYRVLRDRVAGRPIDRRERYIEGIQSATLEEIAAAAHYMAPHDSLTVIVVGDPSSFDTPLDSLGFGAPTILDPVLFGE
ncbi:MAG: insulinase family protein [Candidatus Eisenbacteria bacterium]|nr:insulinase family protein [Candidatus Eisenbacteria bacterium]